MSAPEELYFLIVLIDFLHTQMKVTWIEEGESLEISYWRPTPAMLCRTATCRKADCCCLAPESVPRVFA
jgi:hypothetical protein